MSREDELFLAECRERLGGFGFSKHQAEIVLKAYHARPSHVLVRLEQASTKAKPLPYFVAAAAGIADEAPTPVKPIERRHDMAPVACLDCGDTGFVVLIRDVGIEAQAGDAAPCHCSTGQQKMNRYGVVHYVAGDYEPAVPDPTVPLMSFKDYCESDAGKADPHLAKILRRGGPQIQSLADEIGWKDEA